MIKQTKLSDVITERLESMIVDGTLSAGEKLLPERELAAKFKVSRPSLREAIQNLHAKGLIERKQGGGTFVSQHLNKRLSDPLLALISKRPETQFDLLEFRHALEGMAAFYAALRGQKQDHNALTQALEKLQSASTKAKPEEEAIALGEFYFAMAQASQNMVLVQVMQAMRLPLEDNVKQNLAMLRSGASVESELSQQRTNIVLAIISGNPEAARDASHLHLSFIEKTLLDINKNKANVQRSLRRIVSDN
ncbi:GntR family transcriptional regulator, transcriptional repressor for pyruvate dehydrogenase complex [Glaciecola punicea ACAM 611]|jgi:GntR family transcriptional repressor for pyruvate dehydrogenase complex|uniref:Pyruvate dehydrogenase complex repressor n=1 Tax=Glaciecola punicea ACAM 611 TaxID=1121923 RepID=H5TDN6_9ALTE|nr:GntR family transcriptional regulator [Glaciecola punicea]OFA32444.1 transcriptional regulator PdhR [Glaciecola punicea]GAB56413.1 GntR family transcriptional regulator, transcriptional repressor for pyruvate dehydrogenase complex [Glaciecola punicea ACAM 611]